MAGGAAKVSEADAGPGALLAGFFDAAWYLARYPDIVAGNHDPLDHFVRFGAAERRDPNRFFDGAWYLDNNPDVAASGANPLLHYLEAGAAELRRPHPRFDAAWYVEQHPEAAQNPLLHYLRVGLAGGYLTEKPLEIRDYLASVGVAKARPVGVFADVVIVVGADQAAARRCVASVLADRSLPLARVIVVDDRAAKAELSGWLNEMAADGAIHLIRNRRGMGFAASVNRAIQDADSHDVVLLRGDAVVPPGWVGRLAAHAYAARDIATVSALSNHLVFSGSAEDHGIPVSAGQTAVQIDEVCCSVNAGRAAEVPTGVGGCLYIRAEALHAAGDLAADHFGHGAGAETDFCLRASSLGWRHLLAGDVFVYQSGAVGGSGPVLKLLLERHADYADRIRRNSILAALAPLRFSITAALFRAARLPVILMVSHNYGGGVRRHIDSLVERYADAARVLLLEGGDQGVTLSVPGMAGHPVLTLPPDRIDDLVAILHAMALSRVHIHHLLRMNMDIRRLIHRLHVPFDVTVHDYMAICPQINLLKWPESLYCGEPAPAECNTCVAENNAHGARDIFSWRRDKAWQFIEADRVICPSVDVKDRLERHGVGGNAIVVPHEQQPETQWRVVLPDCTGAALRIVVLGVLANHKGARTVASVAAASAAGRIEIRLIGDVEDSFPKSALKLIKVTGQYREEQLADLLGKARPDVFWFPSSAAETYSFTLSTAIATGLPIVATDLGSFSERLAGRPNTWLVDHRATAQDWLAVFDDVRARLADRPVAPPADRLPVVSDFYADRYLATPVKTPVTRRKIVIVPERLDNGALTTGAYLRLLQPLDHPAVSDGKEVILADIETVLDYRADIIVTQAQALPDLEAVEALAAHARRTGAILVLDLDDDLVNVARGDAELRRAAARMVVLADVVWVSTQRLADRLAGMRPDAVVMETRLDERIWAPPPLPSWDDPVRILCMESRSHDKDFALIAPALTRLKAEYGDRVMFDILGMTSSSEPPAGLNRVMLSSHATRSYPGFVHWLTGIRPAWHIGLAPLLDSPANRYRSATTVLDYAAMGLVVLASDTPAYRGSIADGPAGQLVANTTGAWYAALNWLIRDQAFRQAASARARAAFLQQGTLASQAETRRAGLARVPRHSETAA